MYVLCIYLCMYAPNASVYIYIYIMMYVFMYVCSASLEKRAANTHSKTANKVENALYLCVINIDC